MVMLPRFDPTNLDLTDFDVQAMLDSNAGRAARTAVDAAAVGARELTYVSVGLTLLTLQRLRVRRREFLKSLHP